LCPEDSESPQTGPRNEAIEGPQEEAALLQGEAGPAYDLPTSAACFFRILYVESPGPNVLFACKTTMHQTVPVPQSMEGGWEWPDDNAFRFEVLPPCSNDPIRGEVLMAVFESREGGTTSFVGQVVIDLASAAEPGAEKLIEGYFPLRTRKGDVLPGGARLHVRMSIHLPVPPPPPNPEEMTDLHATNEGKQKSRSSVTGRPPKSATGTIRRKSTKQATAPRLAHNAINRQKWQDKLSKENRMLAERMNKIKPGTTTNSRKRSVCSTAGGEGKVDNSEIKLTIEIPGEEGSRVAAGPSKTITETVSVVGSTHKGKHRHLQDKLTTTLYCLPRRIYVTRSVLCNRRLRP